jgi:WD40 repeat protein
VYSIAWSRDGRQLVSGSADRTVRVWNFDNGECVQKLEGHTDEVYAVAFHPDGTCIASASRNAAIALWDTASGKQLLRLKGHTSYVYSLAFSRDGSTLVSGSGDCTVRLWDTKPLAQRIQAKRDADALGLEANKLVFRLFADGAEADHVVAAIRADTTLNDDERHAALRAVLRRQAPP